MSTILIATDGSPAAVTAEQNGIELARELGDDVVFVAVWHPLLIGAFGVPPTYVNEDVLVAERSWAEEALAAAAGRARAAGVSAETLLAEGQAAGEICRIAAHFHVRMIVIGSHGWGAMRTVLSRSTVSGVLAHAPCPVLSGAPPRAALQVAAPEERRAS